jgi:hypothetical protein
MKQGRTLSKKAKVMDAGPDQASSRNGVLRPDLPRIEARLTLRPTADGGRRTGIRAGYRAHWWVYHPNGECTHHDGPLDLLDRERLEPGETASIRILPIAPEFWRDLEVGSRLEMWEGGVVGTATVTSLHL